MKQSWYSTALIVGYCTAAQARPFTTTIMHNALLHTIIARTCYTYAIPPLQQLTIPTTTVERYPSIYTALSFCGNIACNILIQRYFDHRATTMPILSRLRLCQRISSIIDPCYCIAFVTANNILPYTQFMNDAPDKPYTNNILLGSLLGQIAYSSMHITTELDALSLFCHGIAAQHTWNTLYATSKSTQLPEPETTMPAPPRWIRMLRIPLSHATITEIYSGSLLGKLLKQLQANEI